MKTFHACAAASLLVCCGLLISCDSRGGASLTDVISQPGGSSGLPFDGALSARVRNESSFSVDVTMRFVRAERELHKAFLRVPVETVTTVVSPDMADIVELSGLDEHGDVLPPAVFYYGVDFDEERPAEYVVIDRVGHDPNAPWVVVQPVSGQQPDGSSDEGETAGGDGESNDDGAEDDDAGSGNGPADGDPGDDTPGDDGGQNDSGDDAGSGPGDDDGDAGDDAADDQGDDEGDADDPDDNGDDDQGAGDDDQGGLAGGDPDGDADDDSQNPDIVVIGRPEEVPPQRAVPNDSADIVIEYTPETPVIPAGMFLTNIPYGGDAVVPVDLPVDWRPSGRDPFMQLVVSYDLVPNETWPRTFDLVIQYHTARGLRSVVAPRPYWIPQLVEVLEASPNLPCGSNAPMGRGLFAGIELLWYGGGVAENRPATSVAFWLSRDGDVPLELQDDAEHRLLMITTGSPNLIQLAQIDADTVLNGQVWVGPAGGVASGRNGGAENSVGTVPLLEGEYRIVVVGDYGEFGQLVTIPDLPPITICAPASHND